MAKIKSSDVASMVQTNQGLRVVFQVYAVALTLGLFSIGSLSRFTWCSCPLNELRAGLTTGRWGILVQLVYATAVLFRVHYRIYLFVALLQLVILIGVLVMSGSRCALFLEALDEEGAVIYFYGGVHAIAAETSSDPTDAGTFILHYMPAVLTVPTPRAIGQQWLTQCKGVDVHAQMDRGRARDADAWGGVALWAVLLGSEPG